MHICLLNMQIEYYSPVSGGAVATVMMQYARNLLALGHRVTVLTAVNGDEVYPVGDVVPIRNGNRKTINAVQSRVSALRQRIESWDYPHYEYYIRSFKAALRRLLPMPDVVLIHNDFVAPRHIKKALPRTKVVLMLHNETRTNLRDKRKALSYVDLFLPLGCYIRDWTAKAYDIATNKIVPVRNGVDLEVFKPRDNYLDPAKPVRVLFIGRIDPNKGPDLAADAVAQLRREGVPVTLSVAGSLWFYGHGNEMEDPYFRSLKTKMDAAEADYLGHVTRANVPRLVRDHDVVCVLSRSQEPYPLVVLEAMASGCAVLASDRGGLPEVCGGAAIVANPDDLRCVVDRLRSLAADRKLLRTTKIKSVERAARESWPEKTERLEGIFKKELGL